MSRNDSLLITLKKYMPDGGAEYAHEILWKYGIQLHIKKPRRTKLGDYRPPRPGEPHRISINNDLNPYAFLVTFLHEAAHLVNFEKNGFKVMPHGGEWKQEFHSISQPILHAHILPEKVMFALDRYLKNPKASSCTDPYLYRTLKQFDIQKDNTLLVEEVPMGAKFNLGDGRVFVKQERLRSRYRCLELKTNKSYLVPGLMEVEILP